MHSPMIYTTEAELEKYGKLWDAWASPKKPARLWFVWWCVGCRDVPDDQKVTAYEKSLTVH